jgi:hypothetical protein
MFPSSRSTWSPLQRGLVVCKKTLFDQQRVPNWPDRDLRFEEPARYTKNYEWDVGGRKLCATHWGSGIGSNDWKDADVVFLFDEFHLPRRAAIANVQGHRGHGVHEGDLPTMKTLNSRAPAVDIFALGHRLRWLKQMALRGRARCYDEHGVCGKQRLVAACDLGTFMSNVGMLFPGAAVRTTGAGDSGKWTERVIAILNDSKALAVTTGELGRLLAQAMAVFVVQRVDAGVLERPRRHGVAVRAREGPQGGRFERMEAEEALAA